MARGINKVFLLGHLGKDPEVKSFANGGTVCTVSLATSESWKNRDGERQEHTEWHNLVFNDKLAEVAGDYLRKGSKVLVEGKIRTRKYQDKEGKEARFMEIRVSDLTMLDPRPESDRQQSSRSQSSGSQNNEPQRSATTDGGDFDLDSDIPF